MVMAVLLVMMTVMMSIIMTLMTLMMTVIMVIMVIMVIRLRTVTSCCRILTCGEKRVFEDDNHVKHCKKMYRDIQKIFSKLGFNDDVRTQSPPVSHTGRSGTVGRVRALYAVITGLVPS